MATFNTVTVLGNLTADPDLSYTTSGKALCRIDIAVGRAATGAQNQNKTDFFTVELWEKLAELLAQWCKKGRLLLISGRLKQDIWEDNEGKRHYKVVIVATNIQFLGKPKSDEKQDLAKKDSSGQNENAASKPPAEDPAFAGIPEDAEQ